MHQVPVAQDHRRARPAQERRRGQEARDGQHLRGQGPAGRDVGRLGEQRHETSRRRGGQNRRPDGGERTANGRPIEHDGRFGHRQRHQSHLCGRRRVGRWPERERDGNQNGREAGVEAEELHARVLGDEREREDDAEPEVRQEQEQNHARPTRPSLPALPARAPTRPPCLPRLPYLPSRLLISAQLTTFHQP